MRRIVTRHESVGKDRWIVSYADLLTLLFCFFVVMYSISSVDVSKYSQLSDSLEEQLSDSEQEHQKNLEEFEASRELSEFEKNLIENAEKQVNSLAQAVEEEFQELIEEERVQVSRHPYWLEVEFKSNMLFESGNSAILPEAVPVLRNLAQELLTVENRVQIEGFTDNRPINTEAFPSNWELSSARASSVVRLFENEGVNPQRLASIGYGEHQPIADNRLESGRAKNRRVVVVIMAALGGDARLYQLEALQTQASL